MKGDDVSPHVMDEVVDVGVAVGALVLLKRTAVVLNARKVVALAYGGRVVLKRGMPVELRNGADVVALAKGNRVLLEIGTTVELRNGAEAVALANANGGLVAFRDGTAVTFPKGARVALVSGSLVAFSEGADVVAFKNGANVEFDFTAVLVAWKTAALVDEFEKDAAVLEVPTETDGLVVFTKRPLPVRLADVRAMVVFDPDIVLLAKSGAEVDVAFANGALLVVLRKSVFEPRSVGDRALLGEVDTGPPLDPTTLLSDVPCFPV